MKKMLGALLISVVAAFVTAACIPSGQDCLDLYNGQVQLIEYLNNGMQYGDLSDADIAAAQQALGDMAAAFNGGCPAMYGG